MAPELTLDNGALDPSRLFRRLIDRADYDWIELQAGPNAAQQLRRARRPIYRTLLQRLRKEGETIVKARLQARSAGLDEIIRFDVQFHYLLTKMWLTGQLHFAGIRMEIPMESAFAGLQALFRMSLEPVAAHH
jgi:hypothetical protein